MLQIHSSLRVAGRLKKANIECVVLAGSSFILCEWCTLFQMTRCVCILGVHRDRIFKGKWRSRGLNELNFFWPRRGGASRPARPRRLEAGAARLGRWGYLPKNLFICCTFWEPDPAPSLFIGDKPHTHTRQNQTHHAVGRGQGPSRPHLLAAITRASLLRVDV